MGEVVILIGAARSGTKIFRDMLAEHPDVDRVPYDVTYVWHIGNQDIDHDAIPTDRFTPEIAAEIRSELEKFREGGCVLVEKTVGNSVRVPFVHAVYPQARFIHLVRDGWDVVESSYRQWTKPPDRRALLTKLKRFPVRKAFPYLLRYGRATISRLLPGVSMPGASWGVRYPDIDQDVAGRSVLEVCARQWTESVEQALAGFNGLSKDVVWTVRYEDFVRDPRAQVVAALEFMGLDPARLPPGAETRVDQVNVGKGLRRLTAQEIERVEPTIAATMRRLGYN